MNFQVICHELLLNWKSFFLVGNLPFHIWSFAVNIITFPWDFVWKRLGTIALENFEKNVIHLSVFIAIRIIYFWRLIFPTISENNSKYRQAVRAAHGILYCVCVFFFILVDRLIFFILNGINWMNIEQYWSDTIHS